MSRTRFAAIAERAQNMDGLQRTLEPVSAVGQYKMQMDIADGDVKMSVDGGAWFLIGSSAGGGTLQSAYTGSAGASPSVDMTAAFGAISFRNNSAANSNALEVEKSPAGAQSGNALNVTLGANGTGAAVNVAFAGTQAATATGAAVLVRSTATLKRITSFLVRNTQAKAGGLHYTEWDAAAVLTATGVDCYYTDGQTNVDALTNNAEFRGHVFLIPATTATGTRGVLVSSLQRAGAVYEALLAQTTGAPSGFLATMSSTATQASYGFNYTRTITPTAATTFSGGAIVVTNTPGNVASTESGVLVSIAHTSGALATDTTTGLAITMTPGAAAAVVGQTITMGANATSYAFSVSNASTSNSARGAYITMTGNAAAAGLEIAMGASTAWAPAIYLSTLTTNTSVASYMLSMSSSGAASSKGGVGIFNASATVGSNVRMLHVVDGQSITADGTTALTTTMSGTRSSTSLIQRVGTFNATGTYDANLLLVSQTPTLNGGGQTLTLNQALVAITHTPVLTAGTITDTSTGLAITMTPASAGVVVGQTISMGANASGNGLSITHAGTGAGLLVNHTGASGNLVTLQDGSTQVFAVIQDGIGIFGNTSTAYGTLGGLLEVNVSANYGGSAYNTWSTTADHAPFLLLRRSKSATIGTQTLVASGDRLGAITFQGSDGTSFINGASISCFVDGTPSGSDMPGRLVFYTTPDGSLTVTQRMTIINSGEVIFGGTTNTLYGGGLGSLIETNTTANYGGVSHNTWSVTGDHAPFVLLRHSKTNTIGTQAAVANGDRLGAMTFQGSDGTSFVNGASIACFVDADTGASDMPGRLVFYTSPNGSATIVQRMTILNSGITIIGGTTNTAYGTLGALLETNVSANYGGAVFNTWSTSTDQASLLVFNRSKSATIGTQGAVTTTTDRVGGMLFRASDGTDFRSTAEISCYIDGTPGASDMPSRLMFFTSPDGSIAPLQRLTILNSGVVTIGGTTNTAYGRLGQLIETNVSANNGGIALNAWSATASQGAVFDFNRSKSATIGTLTSAVVANDVLGYIEFRGSDGVSAFQNGVSFQARAEGTFSATSSPASLVVWTTPSGAVATVERIRFMATGGFSIGPTTATAATQGGFQWGTGLTFTAAAPELLGPSDTGMFISAGAATGTAAGNAVTITAGAASTTGAGGGVNLTASAAAGSTGSAGGSITITPTSGAVHTTGTAGAAGSITIVAVTGGSASGAAGVGGQGSSFVVTTGTGGASTNAASGNAGAAGQYTLVGGVGGASTAATGGAGGGMTFTGGVGGAGVTGGKGGSWSITLGSAGSGGNASGGDFTLVCGAGIGTGIGGPVDITTGAGANGTNGGASGGLLFRNGIPGTATTGTGGNAGDFTVNSRAGGAATGAAGIGGTGSDIVMNCGAGGAASDAASGNGGAGGTFSSTLGAGGASTAATGGAGGGYALVTGNGGAGVTGGVPGSFSITIGNAGTGGNANGGNVTIQLGTRTGSGTPGQFRVRLSDGATDPIIVTNGDAVTIATSSGTLGFYGLATPIARGATVADAAGGATVDAEARTAINTLLARVRAVNLIAT